MRPLQIYDDLVRHGHFGHTEEHCHPTPPPAPAIDPIPKPTIEMAKDKGKGKEVVIEPPKRWIPVQRDHKRQNDASTFGVQILLSMSTVITSVPLLTGTSSHAQTQPSVPSVAPPNSPSDTVSGASYIPGPTPGRAQAPTPTSSPSVCHQNVEASIPSLQSSSDDLVGLDERTENDGFIPVVRKRHPWATDTPHLSRRITRSQSYDTSSHSPSL
ncbi:putative uncharacterized protein DDB_G0290521 [Olea europaea var. sylvestris]|uniref:putative uncharacterized protein DDB_G0290521 n=1 Tax=Olea europaea var. sylvestris TaxID=158386 RepID=UPI000C1CD2E4|nr:putative uncharacterized protein DDB_G0290521 [Olea europaea var. sylvestris]